MKHHIFAEATSYPVAVLSKGTSFNKQEIINNYVDPLNTLGIQKDQVIAFTLKYDSTGKAPVKFIKEYLDNLLPALDSLGVKYLYAADANYFKVLTKQTKAEPHHGYVLPCALKGYEHMKVVLGVNYQALIYNPELKDKLSMGLKALADSKAGTYQAIGTDIIHSAYYPESLSAIAAALDSLHQYSELTCDIEAFSLRFNEAGIGTIAFAWDLHNGLAFACDYREYCKSIEGMADLRIGQQESNNEVRKLLLNFFLTYKGEITWHNATYDLKCIIYSLWMKDLLDTEGLLTGLDVMTRSFQDSKIITYLATNSTAGNVLGLKPLAQEFAGNWAQDDIKDIRKIPLNDLLRYNLVDCLSTWYVKNKYIPRMIQDNQLDLYNELMLPSLKLIMQIELTGMPLDQTKVQEVKAKLESIQQTHLDLITNSPLIKALNLLIQNSAMVAANAKLKVKQHGLDHFSDVAFNPNSGPQLQKLLYEQMGLPVIDFTDTKQPATGAETIEKLINHTTEPAYKEVLSALIGYGKVSKILTTFIPAFERAILKGDGITWLHGSFNLGGTVSGRLSSSSPNLQNIPAGSIYAKLIKECFISPNGWVFAGADFAALESVIDTLLTRDPMKEIVFTDGFDSHCLASYFYFKEQMPDITEELNGYFDD